MLRRKRVAPSVPVSSMADIAFLLLVFFMVTSVLDSDPDLPINLPDVPGGEQLNKKIANLYLTADEKRTVYFNSVKMELNEAMSEIRAKLSTTPDLKVLIHADQDLTYEELDSVFETLREIGALKVSLVTKTTQGGGLKGK
ncbi:MULTISPECIES: ExbD/TolR family protein [Leptospira]|uniref:Transport energizing protein, ExbD/TolR family n=5 Tax=Leptospira TaxID=171 RepID=N1W0U7_9LEPT|nr:MULTISPECIES: biopolymer transporter ExbD [Leptospira]EMY62642.1 transport energizing protein, ExbD/TolR family [Leptospira terpstrae serovar Hualin str. LT 11-33 = ATCC 700639]EMY71402.1 transport energizing protein, ExbD/TolR family [Leptospira vanthielii serovar Holland str. Waz Holland = ATCC 700522]EOQ95162.1 transport energizing protein, ExbD/TolR family [Leptospira wolbachii serovar Codice str. CDC]MBM9548357.1 biopolymer transporter ExbD [Leptospira abararensis]MBM9590164.1 biopolym